MRRTVLPTLGIVFLALPPLAILLVFMHTNTANVPRFDQFRTVPVAVAAVDGTLRPAHIFQPMNGHITAFTNLLSAANARLTHWNQRVEAYANVVLALVNYSLYMALFWRTAHRRIAWVAVPFSMLVFSVQQDFNWIIAYDGAWHFGILWFLAALTTLAYYPARRWSLLLSAFFCTCATFSIGSGFLAWGGVLVHLLLMPHNRWRRVALWLLLAAPVVALFFYLALPTANELEPVADIVPLPRLWRFFLYIEFMVGYVGAVFASLMDGYRAAVYMGALGLLMLVINMILLRRNVHVLRLWLPLIAYALAVGLLVGYTRIATHGQERVFRTWYTTSAMLFWIGLVALMVTAPRRGKAGVTVLVVNVLFAGLLVVRYIDTNLEDVQAPFAQLVRTTRADCYIDAVFRQAYTDETCYITVSLAQANALAARRLSMFADVPQVSVIPPDDTAPVIVETHTVWLNSHIRDYLLHGIPPHRVHHIYPPSQATTIDLPAPPPLTDRPAAALAAHDRFWYISHQQAPSRVPAQACGYTPARTLKPAPGITVTEYVQTGTRNDCDQSS